MGWLHKILGIKEKPVEVQEVQELPQPKGELVGQCAFCGLAIGSEDVYRKLPTATEQIAHKRCIKKAQREAFNGKNPENIFSEKEVQ